MLLKNSAIYLLSSLSVGFVSFIAVAVYTRLIEPTEYGKFAIAMAVVNLSDALLFSWLRVSVTRLLLAQHERGIFLSNVIFLHGVMLCLITVGAFVVLGIGIEYSWAIIVLILILVCLRGFVELKFCILQVELRSARFLIANNTRVLSQVVAAILFIIVGLNVEGMLLGYVVGASVAFLVAGKLWALKQTQLNIGVLRKISSFGLPLAFGFLADSVTTMSGRLVLGWLGSLEEAAVFSVSHDTVGWPLQALFMSVNLAGFPLASGFVSIPSNTTRPRRTMVAPHSTATSKSSLMPMLRVSNDGPTCRFLRTSSNSSRVRRNTLLSRSSVAACGPMVIKPHTFR